jgi:hypothetical protein
MIALAPETAECIPDRLSRVPIATLQPASRTPVEEHSPRTRKLLVAHAGAIAEDIRCAFDRFGAAIMGTRLMDDDAQFPSSGSAQRASARCLAPVAAPKIDWARCGLKRRSRGEDDFISHASLLVHSKQRVHPNNAANSSAETIRVFCDGRGPGGRPCRPSRGNRPCRLRTTPTENRR